MAKIVKVLALSIILFTGARPCDRYIDIDRFKSDFEYYLMMSEWGGMTPMRIADAYATIERYKSFFSCLCNVCKHECSKQCKSALRNLRRHLRECRNQPVKYL